MNFLSRYASAILLLSIIAFAASGILQYFGISSLTGLFFIGALLMLALAFSGFSTTKGFAYTIWILVAVSAAMIYPDSFQTIGSFELKGVIVPFVQLTMFGMGAHMSFDDFKGVIMMPKGVMIGVFCHFFVMPLVAFGLSHLFPFPPEIAGGIILIGCVSSAMASNVMSYLAGANLALAITIGSVSTILSPFVTPFLMQWLGGQYVEIDVAHMMIDITKMIIIPVVAGFIFNMFYYGNTTNRMMGIQLFSFALIMIITNSILAMITDGAFSTFISSALSSFLWFYFLPMIAAILLKRSKNIDRKMIESSLSFVAMLGIVVNTVVITASGRDNLLAVGGLLIVTCLIHNIAGLSLGYFLAMLFGLPEKDRRTIAFEVGMQNGGVATGLALQMGKVSTVGLASTIFGPLQNITGSALANWFRKQDRNPAPTIESDSQETVVENLR